MPNEERAFDAYRHAPDPESLRALLEVNQPRVYNLCFQVTRHRQDAEDASQQALMKAAQGAASLPDAQQFHRWMTRVALNCALDLKRTRARRIERERTVAAGNDSDDSAAGAVHEALAKLDDESRCLLVRHHFERRTLEDLAREERCSTVAVWKRIQKGKDLLKKALSASGFACVVPRLDSILDGNVGIGGVVMATKGTFSLAAISVALLCLGLGTGAGMLIQARQNQPQPTTPRTLPAEIRRPQETTVSNATSEDPAAAAEVVVLRRRVTELEGQVARTSLPAKDKRQIAGEIWEQILPIIGRNESEVGGERLINALARLQELDQEMTPYFVGRFHAEESPREILCSIFLALYAGGPAATELMKELMLRGGGTEQKRAILIDVITSRDGILTLDRVPMDAEMLALAQTDVQSEVHRKRMAGAAILGACPAEQSRGTLQNLATNDPAPSVQAAAIRALARKGDAATLAFLRGIHRPDSAVDPDLDREFSRAIRALEAKVEGTKTP